MRIRHAGREDKIELQMTPMIDIVFQLLIFFIMTFKIVVPEGDFNIRMPSASADAPQEPVDSPTLQLRLRANADGSLARISIEGTSLESFDELQQIIIRRVQSGGGPGEEGSDQEIEIDADYNLKYDYVMQAITAISGYVENRQQHKLIERIKFAPVSKP